MSLTKHNDTEWELSWCNDSGSYEGREITATAGGLDIGTSTIPWRELDHAREVAYKAIGSMDMSASREKFEAVIRGLDIKYPLIFKKWPDGTYHQNEIQSMWAGWQFALSAF